MFRSLSNGNRPSHCLIRASHTLAFSAPFAWTYSFACFRRRFLDRGQFLSLFANHRNRINVCWQLPIALFVLVCQTDAQFNPDDKISQSRTLVLRFASSSPHDGAFLADVNMVCLFWAQILPNNRFKIVHSIKLEDGLLLVLGLDHQVYPFPLVRGAPPPTGPFYFQFLWEDGAATGVGALFHYCHGARPWR
jgi:hypothetical protein